MATGTVSVAFEAILLFRGLRLLAFNHRHPVSVAFEAILLFRVLALPDFSHYRQPFQSPSRRFFYLGTGEVQISMRSDLSAVSVAFEAILLFRDRFPPGSFLSQLRFSRLRGDSFI